MQRLGHRIAAAESRRVSPLYGDDKGILDEVRAWLDNLPASADGNLWSACWPGTTGREATAWLWGKRRRVRGTGGWPGRRPRRLRRRRIQN